jgi:hypothetical protein
MIDLAKRRDTSEANREALDPQDAMLGFRSVLAATIGNMLEFYDFVTFSFFDSDRARFLSVQKSIREPDALVSNVRSWLCNQTHWCTGHWNIFRSRRAPPGDAVEFYYDGMRHRRFGGNTSLRFNWNCRSHNRYLCALGAGAVLGRRSRTDDRLFIGGRAADKTRGRGGLATC